MKFRLQKLDRRMTGHQWFKYRIEFPINAVRDIKIDNMTVYAVRLVIVSEIMQGLTNAIGFGPYVDYTPYAKDPKWAFRTADSNHVDTIYLTEEAVAAYEQILTFLTLKYSA